MDFDKFFTAAPKIRPFLNVGCLFDIPTGKYKLGAHGESILAGGLAYVTGVGGRGNSFKSVLSQFFILVCLARHIQSKAQAHDTETSLTLARLYQLAMRHEAIAGIDLEEEGRLFLSDNTVMSGNVWWDKMRAFAEAKQKDAKHFIKDTPFIDAEGKYIPAYYPTLSMLDSLSMLTTDSVERIYEKNQIGEGGANTDSMRAAAAKSQMLMQLPTVTGMAGIFMILTAHVGDEIPMDQYAPSTKKLAFFKGNMKFKHVPEKFTFLTNNLWLVNKTEVLANKATKAPEFPLTQDDNMEGDTDLQIITVQNMRCKSGPTGMPFQVIVSQSEGVLVGLTEFWYLRSFDGYGIGGHDRSYFLELLPDVSLSRTTIRGKINENAKLRRALEITSEMCQIKNLWDDPEGLNCTPKELYEDLKAKGYDWDTLLNTRGYWVFNEDEKSNLLPFLSTMDLLRMRKGLYHPYWLDNKVEAKKK